MSVFDRSWYGRVLVERVEGFASDEQWRRAYQEIVDLERTLCAEGMLLIKFWLRISHEEQERRFVRRQHDRLKEWKLTGEDWRNRENRTAYIDAVEEMLQRTSHPEAPWVVVEAELKRFARVKVLEETNRLIEAGLPRWGITAPG